MIKFYNCSNIVNLPIHSSLQDHDSFLESIFNLQNG
ncbi:hypothetical protein SLEP1_g12276 [Rubroshorea leprosula]|uniref:Uncharacterized protein n=1 Tax=Rubroshorea leprosula TaxID=152421 RepID=A0AAV5IMQ2_9ROSI|nr:hypothetical protein SLEP1_g12276 [Rubroshorea leprosula]